MHKFIVYIGIVLVLLIVTIIASMLKYCRTRKNYSYENELRTTGKRIPVKLQHCQVKTNSYYETEDNSSGLPSHIEMIDALFDADRPAEAVKNTVSVIVYKHPHPSGKIFEFRSRIIEMPAENLRYIMEQGKQAFLYVDQANWHRYYFDVGF